MEDRIALRLSPELLARIDAESARLTREVGVRFTRSDVVRTVLLRGLAPTESEQHQKKKKPARRAA